MKQPLDGGVQDQNMVFYDTSYGDYRAQLFDHRGSHRRGPSRDQEVIDEDSLEDM